MNKIAIHTHVIFRPRKAMLNLDGIRNLVTLFFVIYLSMIEMSRLTSLMHWQITFRIILPLLSAHICIHFCTLKKAERQNLNI